MKEWTVGGAERAHRLGELQGWVVGYMSGGDWENAGLAEGIELAPRWWIGPELVDVRILDRTCGPEPEMPYRVSPESWSERTEAIAGSMGEPSFDLRSMPPLITEYRDGRFAVADGNHRLGAFEAVDQDQAWVIVWSNSEEDHDEALQRLGMS